MPIDGGLVIVPEGLLHPIRRATFDDALRAVAGANEAGVISLLVLFPELVEYARNLRADEN